MEWLRYMQGYLMAAIALAKANARQVSADSDMGANWRARLSGLDGEIKAYELTLETVNQLIATEEARIAEGDSYERTD